jgi:hypothetical protein
VAFTLPASAFESVFGGYWRTRAFSQQNFSGDESLGRDTKAAVRGLGINSPGDLSRVDTRTRLYYTAILNDNLKFVNRFEFDAEWGEGNPGYGNFGTDGQVFEVKHSFADITMGAFRMTIGAQGHAIARGFVFDDDYAGITASYKMGDHLIPFTWAKINDSGTDLNSKDADMFALWPVFQVGESWSLSPFAVYVYSDDTDPTNVNHNIQGPSFLNTTGSVLGLAGGGSLNAFADDGVSLYWLGLSVDGSVGGFNLWGTAIYQGGTADDSADGGNDVDVDDWDIKAYMVAAGASVPLGPANLHGQAFFASGDDDLDDTDIEEFFGTNGQSYYWAEIMGNGTFDNVVSAGSPGNKIGNIVAANIGATIKPMEKLSLTGDIWYATKVEDDILTDEKDLGIEVDLKATYMLVEGLNLDIIGAYLFADDATSILGENEDDPWEVGTRLSLSF